jgi:ribosome recycling factor
MEKDFKKDMDGRMEGSLHHLNAELATVRTGRASLSLFDSVRVVYYGTPTPLSQMASLSIPDSRTITIQPWDVSQLQEIEKAISSANLGLSPSNDGKMIRIMVPPLTEDRRKELVKRVKKMGEESKIAIRNIRRETNDLFKTEQKEGHISEDMLHTEHDAVQKITNQKILKVDEILSKKENEVLEV